MTENNKFVAGDGLEAFFEAERADAPLPSADLLGRIMADAEAVACETVTSETVACETVVPRPGLFASLIEAIGGWPSLAGMAAAGIVGVWIGFSQPAGLDMVAEQFLGTDDTSYLVDLVPAFNADFEEG